MNLNPIISNADGELVTKTASGLTITRQVNDLGMLTARIALGDKLLFEQTVQLSLSRETTLSPAQVLVSAWLAFGLSTPIHDRTIPLNTVYSTRSSFHVSEEMVELAKGYTELLGLDITEAI